MKLEINSIKSAEQLTSIIEKMVEEKNYDYIDAIVEYCRENNVDVETAASLIKKSSPKLKAALKREAEGLNLIRKRKRRIVKIKKGKKRVKRK